MKSQVHPAIFSALLASSAMLSSCVVPVESGYGGPGYTRSYGPDYSDEPVFVETREVTYLPVGATYVYEYNEPHWYHNGTCYRRNSHGGYVIVEKRSSPHHSSNSSHHSTSSHHEVEKKYYEQPKPTHQVQTLSRENRYVQPQHDDHHDSHEELIHKNGHYYKKGPHGQLILVK